MENYYLVKNFEIFSKENISLFYTPEVSAQLKNEALIALLTKLRKARDSKISLSWLQEQIRQHELDERTLQFYLEHEVKIISLLDPQRFQKIMIICDDFDIKQTLKNYFAKANAVDVFCENAESIVDENTLILLFGSTYSAEFFQYYYQLAKEKSAWLLSAYIANHYLIIDNLYQAQKGMPCHFCNFNRQEQLTLSTNSLKKTSWINFCRKLLNENMRFFPAMNLSALERSACVFWLGNALKKIIDPSEVRQFLNELNNYQWVNLKTGESNSETAVHWVLCECVTARD